MNTHNRKSSAIDFLKSLDPDGPEIVARMNSVNSALSESLVERLYGDVYQRPALELRTRLLVTIGALAAGGDMKPQLIYQTKLAFLNGVTLDEVNEVLLQISVFSGFSRAVNAMNVVDALHKEMNLVR